MITNMADFIAAMQNHWDQRKENPLRGALYLCFIADKVLHVHPESARFHKEIRDTIFNPLFGPYNAIDQVVCRVLGLNVIEHDVEKHCNRIREWWLSSAREASTMGDPLPRFHLTYTNWQKLWEHTK